MLGDDGEIDRGSGREDRLLRPRRRWRGSSGSCIRGRRAATSRWREELAELPTRPTVCVTEVPLLYEVGGETRFDKVVVVTASPEARIARRIGPLREREQRLIPDEEKARRADFVYVNDGTLADLDQFVSGVMATLSGHESRLSRRRVLLAALVVGFFYVEETEPSWYARSATRSSTSTSSAGTPSNYDLDAALLAAVIYRESKFDAGRAVVVGRDRAHAAPARHGARGSPSSPGAISSRSTTSTSRRSTSATAPSTFAGCCGSTTTSASRSRRTTRGRRTSTSGSPRAARGSVPRDAGVRRERAQAREVYARAYADELGLD